LPDYGTMMANNGSPTGCGASLITKAFFYSYLVIVGLCLLNLFIAVILDGYFFTVEKEKQVFNSEQVIKY